MISHDNLMRTSAEYRVRNRMLVTKILKLRLSRIQKGKEHLSTQDKLMLVTMESPDLSANFLLRLFKVSLPKQWKFKHADDEDIHYSKQLIELIETDFIPAYEFHARKYAWYEQCLMYQLNFVVLQPSQQQINGYLRQLDKCLDQQPKIELLHHFQQQYPSAQHANALAKSYAGASEYTKAIEWYEWAAQQPTQVNEVAFFGYIESLIHRDQLEYKPQISDVEYAIHLLIQYLKPIDQKAYAKLLQASVKSLLPESILKTRAVQTNILADVGRGLNSLGKSLNHILKVKQFDLPFSKEVIANAPQLLHSEIILEHLAQNEAIRTAVQALLKNNELTAAIEFEPALQQFWLSVQTEPELLKRLITPSQSKAWFETLPNTHFQTKKPLNLAQFQLILEHGLLNYLGEESLDKFHAERNMLYAQRDMVVTEMTAFASWFYQECLQPYLYQQTALFQQMKLILFQSDNIAFTSQLFIYQYEIQQRAQDLSNWMKIKLEKGNDFDRVNAAWVALREVAGFESEIAQDKINALQNTLMQYKTIRNNQILISFDSKEISDYKEDEK